MILYDTTVVYLVAFSNGKATHPAILLQQTGYDCKTSAILIGLPTPVWEILGDVGSVPGKGRVWGEQGAQQGFTTIGSILKNCHFL